MKEQGNKHGPSADSLNGGFIGDTFFLKSVGQSIHRLRVSKRGVGFGLF